MFMQLEMRDIINTMVIDRPIFAENAQQTTYAVGGADYSTPYGGRAPGDPIGYYGSEIVNEAGWLAPDTLPQTTIISWAANIRAATNCDLFVEILLHGYWPFDLYPQCIVTPPPTGGFAVIKGTEDVDPENDISYIGAGETFIVREVAHMFDAEEFRSTTRLLLAKVTDGGDGEGGEAVDMTTSDVLDPSDPGINEWASDPPELPDYDGIGAVQDIGGTGTVYAVDPVTRKSHITYNFTNASPSWTEILTGISTYHAVLDPYSPRITSGWTTGPIFSYNVELDEANNLINLYKCGDLYTTPVPTLLYTHAASGTVNPNSVMVEATANSTYVLIYYTSTSGCHLLKSTDAGVTWTHTPVGHIAAVGEETSITYNFENGEQGWTSSNPALVHTTGSYGYPHSQWPTSVVSPISGGYWLRPSSGEISSGSITRSWPAGSGVTISEVGAAGHTTYFWWYTGIYIRIKYNGGASTAQYSGFFSAGSNKYYTVLQTGLTLTDVTEIAVSVEGHPSGRTNAAIDHVYMKGANILDITAVNVPDVRVGLDAGFFDNKTYAVGYDAISNNYGVYYSPDAATELESIVGTPTSDTPHPEIRILTDNASSPIIVSRNGASNTDLQLYDASTWSDITPAGPYTVVQPTGSWDDMVDGQSILAVAGESDSVKDLVRTDNRGTSWSTLESSVSYTVIRRGGNNAWLGGTGAVYFTDDAGTTIYDKTGDLVVSSVNVLLIL
jgi:hypothetical protein